MMAIVGVWLLGKLKKVWVYLAVALSAFAALFGLYEDIEHKGERKQRARDDADLAKGEQKSAATVVRMAKVPQSETVSQTEEALEDGNF